MLSLIRQNCLFQFSLIFKNGIASAISSLKSKKDIPIFEKKTWPKWHDFHQFAWYYPTVVMPLILLLPLQLSTSSSKRIFFFLNGGPRFWNILDWCHVLSLTCSKAEIYCADKNVLKLEFNVLMKIKKTGYNRDELIIDNTHLNRKHRTLAKLLFQQVETNDVESG